MKIRLHLNSDDLLTTNLKNIYLRFFNHLDIYIQMNVEVSRFKIQCT